MMIREDASWLRTIAYYSLKNRVCLIVNPVYYSCVPIASEFKLLLSSATQQAWTVIYPPHLMDFIYFFPSTLSVDS
jgi:hypothetical protein